MPKGGVLEFDTTSKGLADFFFDTEEETHEFSNNVKKVKGVKGFWHIKIEIADSKDIPYFMKYLKYKY